MPLVINSLRADTHTDKYTHTYQHANKNDFRHTWLKAMHAWFKNQAVVDELKSIELMLISRSHRSAS